MKRNLERTPSFSFLCRECIVWLHVIHRLLRKCPSKHGDTKDNGIMVYFQSHRVLEPNTLKNSGPVPRPRLCPSNDDEIV
jgi:hypothetical protein